MSQHDIEWIFRIGIFAFNAISLILLLCATLLRRPSMSNERKLRLLRLVVLPFMGLAMMLLALIAGLVVLGFF